MKKKYCDGKLRAAAVYLRDLYLSRYYCHMTLADMQSVLYLAQQLFVKKNRRLMFCENFEAGKYGISNKELRSLFSHLPHLSSEYGELLTEKEKESINAVFERYAPFKYGVLDKAVADSASYIKARSTVPAGSAERVPVCCDDML